MLNFAGLLLMAPESMFDKTAVEPLVVTLGTFDNHATEC
jgi:hypothetical protein